MALLASSAVLEGFGVAPPAPTVGPPLLDARQEASSMVTCAWYSLTSSFSDWDALMCEQACTTSDNKFGCSYIPQTCQDNTDPLCAATATPDANVTCCATDFPFCVTGFLTSGAETLTAFRCGRGELSGEAVLYLTPDVASTVTRTTTLTTEEDNQIKTVTEVVTDDGPTADPNDSNSVDGGDASNPGSQDNSSTSDGEASGGRSTPVGAIVGGSIGGVALLLLIAFAIWFIRFQKKKSAAAASSGMEPYRQPEYVGDQSAYTGSPHQGHQTGGGYYAPPTQEYKPQAWEGTSSVYPPTSGAIPPPQAMTQMHNPHQMGPVEMPGHSAYGPPQELPAQGPQGR